MAPHLAKHSDSHIKMQKTHDADCTRVLRGQGRGNLAGEGTCQQAQQPEFHHGTHKAGENEPEPTVSATLGAAPSSGKTQDQRTVGRLTQEGHGQGDGDREPGIPSVSQNYKLWPALCWAHSLPRMIGGSQSDSPQELCAPLRSCLLSADCGVAQPPLHQDL